MINKLPKYLKEDSVQKQGFKQEEKARKHIASGKLWFDPYDLSTKELLIDVKKVIKQKGIRLSEKKMLKLFKKAVEQNKIPVYLVYLNKLTLKIIIERNPNKRIV